MAPERRSADRYGGPPFPSRGDYRPRPSQPHHALAPLIEFIARELTENPEEVWVKETAGQHFVSLELHVDEHDMGKVIGKQGRVAQAIRTLMRVAAAREGRRATLEIR